MKTSHRALLLNKLRALTGAGRDALWVQRERGVPLARQAMDLLQLKLRGVGAQTYYTYSLFDRQRAPDLATRLTFRDASVPSREFAHYVLPCLHGLATRKHLLYRLLPAFGLPTPRIEATYSPTPDGFERNNAMTTRDDLEAFLGGGAPMPLFGKPSSGRRGHGCLALLQRQGDHILLPGGDTVSASELARSIHHNATRHGTYLFTELLQNRADLRALCGATLASIRAVTLVRRGEPELLAAVLLLPRVGKHTSNWDSATSGSLCGALDLQAGTVSDVISSLGPRRRPEPVHPDTGLRVEGYTLEGWDEIRSLLYTASRAMSPFRMQHWDLAVTARGPVLLELELEGATEPIQMHGPPGLYRGQYLSFARDHKVW